MTTENWNKNYIMIIIYTAYIFSLLILTLKVLNVFFLCFKMMCLLTYIKRCFAFLYIYIYTLLLFLNDMLGTAKSVNQNTN